MAQLHRKFTDAQVKELLSRYLKDEIPGRYVQEILGIKRSRFFILLNAYQKDPAAFTIRYRRASQAPRIAPEAEQGILKELATEKRLIENKEVPYFRLQRALREKKSLFREFRIPPPFKSVKDVFCLRLKRIVDAYGRVSINNRALSVNYANEGDGLMVRFYPLNNGMTELRFWRDDRLLDVQQLKTDDLRGLQF